MKYSPQQNLQELNTLALPSRAAQLCTIENSDQAREVVGDCGPDIALVLGGGSNVILNGDIPGLVVVNRILGIEKLSEDDDELIINVGAGEVWDDFVRYCVQHGYWGLENLAAIPGRVGACPIQNIGAYGVEVNSAIREIQLIDRHSGEAKVVEGAQCDFGYRDSRFKGQWRDKYIITAVSFRLSKRALPRLNYGELSNYFAATDAQKLSPQNIYDAVSDIRARKLPNVASHPNVGSFFKNPVVAQEQCHALLKSFPHMPSYPMPDGTVKLAAGWLIDQAGWKGKSIGPVSVHEKQALVLVNSGGATGKDILNAASVIQSDVAAKFDVSLEIEPSVVSCL
ncbi:UDP-N-acetylmuramate dehydrogenase [Halioxenophilus aromaticivorans]|uniref:UDP-N-acetylenolpyruvoylglucosamine reductase n=1 Tax=Halioxenophilus aromaticivorans TaxID=1306992 RepID=A0AAV3TX65_9ALTE